MRRIDIGIVGGGASGCAAAVALARAGCSVAVFERSGYENTRIGETLPPRARVLLEELGVWNEFRGDGHLPAAGSLAAWGSDDLHETQFLFNPYGSGWHLDRRKFESRFAEWAEDAGATVLRNVRVTNIRSLAKSGWRVDAARTHGKESVDCAVVMDASGRASFVGRRLGADRVHYDGLVAVYAFFRTPTDLNDTRTMVEATRNGWWYSSYLPQSRLIAAFMTDANLLPRGAHALHASWWQALEATIYTRGRVDGARRIGQVETIRANTYQMSAIFGENWLSVGDAAMAFDPLSSQGLHNAVRSAVEASRAVQRHLTGDPTGLRDYATREQERFLRFLTTRFAYYRREMRWWNSAFWQPRVTECPGGPPSDASCR
jgi:2-polyprenyl-6-methoxyphenol hydroxylase-like FAD-dependent oxidoreductase